MQFTTGKAARFETEFDAETYTQFTRSSRRSRVTNIDDFRSRDRNRRVPRDLAWKLGGAA